MRVWLLFKILLHPLRAAQERIDAWVMARVERQTGPITLRRNRIYILPTRAGYFFALITLVMLLGAMNYSNSMAFLLTFLLGGIGLVCMHHTHANLVQLQLRRGHCEPVFAGEDACFLIHVENPATQPRYSLALSWPRRESEGDLGDVPPRDLCTLRLHQAAPRRGWLPAGTFSLASEYPLGLFHAWTWAELDMRCLVYPTPAPPGAAPPATSGHGGQSSSGRAGQEEFAGLREYRRGDGPRTIHWKSLPKLQTPMVKQFSETREQELWLDFQQLHQLPLEARLSQLTRWVLDAEAAGRSYGLRLPEKIIAPAQGEAHRRRCLEALALYEGPGR